MEHTFHFNNCMAETGVYLALRKTLGPLTSPPVILCIGSDLAVGDSLGPVTGTMLQKKDGSFSGYIYGTLKIRSRQRKQSISLHFSDARIHTAR